MSAVSSTLTLPNGVVLSNRIVKAAMSECLCDESGSANSLLVALYRHWGRCGAGLLISGNFMVSRVWKECPFAVCVSSSSLSSLSAISGVFCFVSLFVFFSHGLFLQPPLCPLRCSRNSVILAVRLPPPFRGSQLLLLRFRSECFPPPFLRLAK